MPTPPAPPPPPRLSTPQSAAWGDGGSFHELQVADEQGTEIERRARESTQKFFPPLTLLPSPPLHLHLFFVGAAPPAGTSAELSSFFFVRPGNAVGLGALIIPRIKPGDLRRSPSGVATLAVCPEGDFFKGGRTVGDEGRRRAVCAA
jgi:hypothetical protein